MDAVPFAFAIDEAANKSRIGEFVLSLLTAHRATGPAGRYSRRFAFVGAFD